MYSATTVLPVVTTREFPRQVEFDGHLFPGTGPIRDPSDVGPDGILPAARRALASGGEDVSVRLLIADVEERVLNVWGHAGPHRHPPVASVRIQGSPQGEVYRTGQPKSTMVGGDDVFVTPVTARRERIGVLEVAADDSLGPGTQQTARALGMLLGYLITAADHWTDTFHVARRRKDMTLAAEIQWNLLPLAAFATPRVSLAGALEPAYDVGGDAFDYSCGDHELVVGIFDAMGHGLAASRASALVVAAFRNARRCGKGLLEQARFVDQSIEQLEGWDGYITGQMLSIDLATPSQSKIVNAGHPRPYLQRGSEPPRLIDVAANGPMGIGVGELGVEPLPLLPGDRLVLLTDGTFEARPDGGEAYGEERLASQLHGYRERAARETARLVIASVRDHRAADLTDDATIVIVDIPLR
jgi:hypothetical protein